MAASAVVRPSVVKDVVEITVVEYALLLTVEVCMLLGALVEGGFVLAGIVVLLACSVVPIVVPCTVVAADVTLIVEDSAGAAVVV